MKKVSRFIIGAMIGGLIGSTIVILITPESGIETRTALSSRLENLVKEIRTAAEEKKEELKKELEDYKKSSI